MLRIIKLPEIICCEQPENATVRYSQAASK
jgi:hypothetical protein